MIAKLLYTVEFNVQISTIITGDTNIWLFEIRDMNLWIKEFSDNNFLILNKKLNLSILIKLNY